MKFDDLVQQLGHLPFFDLSTVLQISGERESKVQTQLYRWKKAGKIIPLRREMYTLADTYRKVPLYPTVLANQLYQPSYLGGVWALSYYGLIPERIVLYTNVTSRVPRTFTNRFGTFHYAHIKLSCFFGFSLYVIQQQQVWLSSPEKALLDVWYLQMGEWTVDRLTGMRFQNFDIIDTEKLGHYAALFHAPRIIRAVKNWNQYVEQERKGEITL